MSRLTGKEVYSLMEAYQAVYTPQELTEEQVWEGVENWVHSLLEEGYDLSDYTWEEMYEGYITELLGMPDAQNAGANLRQQFGKSRRDVGGAISDVVGSGLRGVIGQTTTSKNPLSQAYNAVTRGATAGGRAAIAGVGGFLTGKPASTDGPAKPKVNPNSSIDNYNTQDPDGTIRSRLKVGPKIVGPKKVGPGSAGPVPPVRPVPGAPAPSVRPVPGAPAPSVRPVPGAPAPRPATPEKPMGGDPMDQWTRANPTLAAKVKPGQSGYNTIRTRLDADNDRQENYDAYDLVLSHLINEGYANTYEAAESIMVNMSQGWRQSIVEAGSRFCKN